MTPRSAIYLVTISIFFWFSSASANFLLVSSIPRDSLRISQKLSPTLAFNEVFYDDIKKLEPFGNGNPNPTFLFKDLKVIKSSILNEKHVSSILKSKIGFSIKSISFNSVNNKIGEHLLNYKKSFNVLGQISENFWNNKKILQLTIRDLII